MTRHCIECGQPYRPAATQQSKLTCSLKCADQRERRRQRLRKHGQHLHEYDQAWKSANGQCAICHHNDTPTNPQYHATDLGLLCPNCHRLTVEHRHNTLVLRQAADLIDQHHNNPSDRTGTLNT